MSTCKFRNLLGMATFQVIEILILWFSFGQLVNCCDDEVTKRPIRTNFTKEEISSRVVYGARAFAVFIKYCGYDEIPDDQLANAEKCTFKRELVNLSFT